MNIHTEQKYDGSWIAYDEDAYSDPGDPCGSGPTPEAAIDDLHFILSERDDPPFPVNLSSLELLAAIDRSGLEIVERAEGPLILCTPAKYDKPEESPRMESVIDAATESDPMPSERGPGHPPKLPQPTETLTIRASAEVIAYLRIWQSPGVFLDELIRETADFKQWQRDRGKK